MSVPIFPASPSHPVMDAKLEKRERMLNLMERASKLEDGSRPHGEAGDKVDPLSTGTHPLFVMLSMVRAVLVLQMFFIVATLVIVMITDDRVVCPSSASLTPHATETASGSVAHLLKVVADKIEGGTTKPRHEDECVPSSPKTNMNMAMFMFNLVVAVVVMGLHHSARVEEILLLSRAERLGSRRLPTSYLMYSAFCSLSALLIQLVAVIVDIKKGPLGGGYFALVSFTATFLVVLALICVIRTGMTYTTSMPHE